MEQLKILDLINTLLNIYVEEGNLPVFYNNEIWDAKSVEIVETSKGKKVVIK
jgi:hypothetical protein